MAQVPQHCCTERPKVHWRRFEQARHSNEDGEDPPEIDEWATEAFNASLSSRLKEPRQWDDANVVIL